MSKLTPEQEEQYREYIEICPSIAERIRNRFIEENELTAWNEKMSKHEPILCETKVVVTDICSRWNYATAGHPALGSIGTVKSLGEGKPYQAVIFYGDKNQKLHLTDGSSYDLTDDPITLHITKTCFSPVTQES